MTAAELRPAVAAVVDAVLATTLPGTAAALEAVFRDAGWTLITEDSDVDDDRRRWSAPEAPASTVPPPAAWITETSGTVHGVGLIVAAETEDDASRLHDDLRTRIESVPALTPTDSDEVWARWSDGDRDVSLARHPASTLLGSTVPPTVHLDVGPVGAA